ncbi:MAG: hypothetical protein EI684_02045 [Candidatus Viridilinea halotolerans]|uniref:Uncharacterized protein n=1 Tax=Candidatus Viridilinea halotolerans TaxID=2491704 RepID=A0A426UA08_9CHLR|nr:MAG: hypothetical protein EI684_02045 [Candidatus Viridilinea halotolerans]
MKTIETTIVIFPDGRVHIPSHIGLPPGEHRAILVIDNTPKITSPQDERKQLRAALKAAGKLTDLTPNEKAVAAQATLTLEEAKTILDRVGDQPLSEIVLAMRGQSE